MAVKLSISSLQLYCQSRNDHISQKSFALTTVNTSSSESLVEYMSIKFYEHIVYSASLLGSFIPGGIAAPLVHHHRLIFKTQNNWRDVPCSPFSDTKSCILVYFYDQRCPSFGSTTLSKLDRKYDPCHLQVTRLIPLRRDRFSSANSMSSPKPRRMQNLVSDDMLQLIC